MFFSRWHSYGIQTFRNPFFYTDTAPSEHYMALSGKEIPVKQRNHRYICGCFNFFDLAFEQSKTKKLRRSLKFVASHKDRITALRRSAMLFWRSRIWLKPEEHHSNGIKYPPFSLLRSDRFPTASELQTFHSYGVVVAFQQTLVTKNHRFSASHPPL